MSLLFLIVRRPPPPTLFPYTTLFRSGAGRAGGPGRPAGAALRAARGGRDGARAGAARAAAPGPRAAGGPGAAADRKSTRLNSSHSQISYAVSCLKKQRKKYGKNSASL